jgi:hypothetical protein
VTDAHPDLVVGVDLDGFALTHRHASRRVAAIKGIVAEELTYDDWSVRVSLGAQVCARPGLTTAVVRATT